MRLVCISDTHSLHRRIPDIPAGDVLIHAGDCLGAGTLNDILDLDEWLGALPHPKKILIAGNHDWAFQKEPERAMEALTNAIYLEDTGVEIEGVNFWGSPWTPSFLDWAFMLDRGHAIREKWNLIPQHIDVLVTHGPPAFVRDEVRLDVWSQNVGCYDLWERVSQIEPKVHIFGHIHEGYGQHKLNRTLFVNASTCTERYRPTNPPIVVDI